MQIILNAGEDYLLHRETIVVLKNCFEFLQKVFLGLIYSFNPSVYSFSC